MEPQRRSDKLRQVEPARQPSLDAVQLAHPGECRDTERACLINPNLQRARLKAVELVFEYLPRAWEKGSNDPEAREKMHNAATIAGLGFGNSMAAMAHGLGHSLGAVLHVPHGRAVGLFLPYTIEFTVRGSLPTRYAGIARFLGLPARDEEESAASLAKAIRGLARRIAQPTSLQEAGISREDFEANLPKLVSNALNDSASIVGLRFPEEEDAEKIFRYAFEGKSVDF